MVEISLSKLEQLVYWAEKGKAAEKNRDKKLIAHETSTD